MTILRSATHLKLEICSLKFYVKLWLALLLHRGALTYFLSGWWGGKNYQKKYQPKDNFVLIWDFLFQDAHAPNMRQLSFSTCFEHIKIGEKCKFMRII